jgi:CRP-like cAMP-binding protein
MLSDEEWIELGLTVEVKVYNAFEAIFKIFQQAQEVMFILSGEVAVTKEPMTGLNYEQFVKDRGSYILLKLISR